MMPVWAVAIILVKIYSLKLFFAATCHPVTVFKRATANQNLVGAGWPLAIGYCQWGRIT